MSWVIAACLFAMIAQPAEVANDQGAKIRIALVGDSTVTEREGWGVGFCDAMSGDVDVINLARGGRSSKSYRDEGHWDAEALPSRADYVLIQFGHNDCPGKGPERETDPDTTYRANVKRYVEEARAAGMKPVLVTSLVRRKFREGGTIDSDLFAYANAAKAVAAETGTPLIDLHARSIEICEKLGPAECEAISPPPKDGKPDRTHLNARGSALFGRVVAEELAVGVPALAAHVKPATAPATTRPAATKNVRIVLAGDSTMTDKAGWGPGLAALLAGDVELINLSRGGRSTRTFYDEGSWRKCLDARPDYVLIQFGHNDEPGTDRSTDREREFPANIRRYVSEARAAGAKPILVTPLVRRQFQPDGTIRSSLSRHAEIIREIAAEMRVPLIDLHDRSKAVCEALGKDACTALLSTAKPDGNFDGTHLTSAGGMLMGAIVAEELRRAVPELRTHLRRVAKP